MGEKVSELTNGEFEKFIESKGLVLIDFFAEWCMPCLMMAPILEDLAEKFSKKIKFGKVNVQDNPKLSAKFNVSSIPCFILMKDGKVIERFIGAMSEEDFSDRLKKFL